MRDRFLTEARTVAALQHPHVVPVYDFVERDGLCLLVMEHLGGGSLADRVAGGPLDALDAPTNTWLDDPFGLEDPR